MRRMWDDLRWLWTWRRIKRYRRQAEFDAFQRRDYEEWERLKQENHALGIWG